MIYKICTVWCVLLLSCYSYGFDKDLEKSIDALNQRAEELYEQQNLAEAINSASDALQLATKEDYYEGLTDSNYILGRIFVELDDSIRSRMYFMAAIEDATKIKNHYICAMSNIRLAELGLQDNDNINDVLVFYEKAEIYSNQLDDSNAKGKHKKDKVVFLINLGFAQANLKIGQTNSAFENLYICLNLQESIVLPDEITARFHYVYGKYHNILENYSIAAEKFYLAKTALKTTKENLSKNSRLFNNIYKTYASSLFELGKDKMAYKVLNELTELSDSVINQERIKFENIAKTKLDIANYKKEAELAEKEMFIQSKLKDRARILNFIVILTSIFLLGSSLFFYKNYKSTRKLAVLLEENNEQLEYSRQKAVKSSRMKSEFISNVSHELRTPLYGVIGLVSILDKSEDIKREDKKLLKSLKFSSDYLMHLVNDILQIEKIEAGKVELVNKKVNITHFINDISNSFKQSLNKSGNKIVCEIDENLPRLIDTDSLRLSQILVNLVSNSAKFTKDGCIWLKAHQIGRNKDNVDIRFTVKDNGIGIDKSKQKEIFEKFSQVYNKDHEDNRGTGLGLAICSNIAQLFDSKIRLKSELGKGSTFTLDITCKISKSQGNSERVKVKTLPLAKKHIGDVKILIAEDNKINQVVTKTLLEKENFKCTIAGNGSLAVKAEAMGDFDLILMDINMPVLNGIEAARQIRKVNKDIPIYALSAANMEELSGSKEKKLFNDFIVKPFDKAELIDKLHISISKYRVTKTSSEDEKINMVSSDNL